MPYNRKALDQSLVAMKKIFQKDPMVAVRSQGFIKVLHSFCIEELKLRGAKTLSKHKLLLLPEAKILTSHKNKNIDVAIVHPTSGPLLVIALRSQMSSLSKNFLNYFEMEVGDVTSLHERFPMCVVGLLYLHPTTSILPGKEKEIFDFARAEKLFSLITSRNRQSDPYGLYEEIAYLRVDFHKNPPIISKNFPSNGDLRIDDFFDKLWKKFTDRNFVLEG